MAEIGVFKGDFSQIILDKSKPSKFHLIDRWNTEQYPDDLYKSVMKKFQTEIDDSTIEINRGSSIQVFRTFEDNYFDWIYLDTDHSYEVTYQELEAYRTKIKNGGVIAGHDYIVGNWNDLVRYGVIEAVYEFCIKYDWEIIFLTMEINQHPSFAIRKIC